MRNGGAGQPSCQQISYCQFVDAPPPRHPGAGPPAILWDQGSFRDEDNDEDLQRLIELAMMPYCRLTKTFGAPSSSPQISSPNATSRPGRRTSVQVSQAEKEQRAVDTQNWTADEDEEAEEDDDDMEVDGYGAEEAPAQAINIAQPAHWTEAAETGRSPNYEREESDGITADSSREDMIPTPIRCVERSGIRRSHRSVAQKNNAFVESNFDPADPEGFATCRICTASVRHHQKRCLLSHAVSLECLVQRVDSDAYPGASQGAGSSQLGASVRPANRRLVRHGRVAAALSEYLEHHFDPVPGGGGYVVGAGNSAEARKWGRRKCRHCHCVVLGKSYRAFMVHLASCTGVVPLVRDLGEIMQKILPECVISSPPEKDVPNFVAKPVQMECQVAEEKEEEDDDDEYEYDARMDLEATTAKEAPGAGNNIDQRASPTAAVVSTPVTIPRRHHHDGSAFEENREFLECHFGPADSSDTRLCRICNAPVRPSLTSRLMRHALSLDCIARRVLTTATRRGACPKIGCSELAFRMARAVMDYRERRLLTDIIGGPILAPGSTATPDETPGRWKCRHCNRLVCRSGTSDILHHLAACTGVRPLVRDLEEIGQTIISEFMHHGRSRADILQENGRYAAYTFTGSDGDGEARKCRICDQVYPTVNTSRLIGHSLTRYCLSRRVQHDLAGEADADPSALVKSCTMAQHSPAVTHSLEMYRSEHFLLPSYGLWECRHCHNTFRVGTTLGACLHHLARCVGIESVIRAATDIVRADVLKLLAEATGSGNGALAASRLGATQHEGRNRDDAS